MQFRNKENHTLEVSAHNIKDSIKNQATKENVGFYSDRFDRIIIAIILNYFTLSINF